jgi:hypothetical protein
MIKAGILIVNKRFHHDCNLDNEFILLTPEEALYASRNANERQQPDIDFDYSIDYLVENSNSVDNLVTNCHPSISGINKDIINTNYSRFANREHQKAEPKKVITALRQEEPEKLPKSIHPGVVNKIEKIVKAIPGISNPAELVREAIHFVTTQRKFDNPWAAVGAFKKLLGKDGSGSWRTPFRMRYEK